jgi:hypothetical protein
MKVLAILALVCSAMAFRVERDAPNGAEAQAHLQRIRESCPGQCLMKDEYREWFQQALPKAREFGKQLAEGGDTQQFLPEIPEGRFAKYCEEIGKIRTCVQACADDEKKTKATAILDAAKELTCDTEIQGKFPCLQQVGKTPNAQCNTECDSFKQPILDAYNSYKTTGQRDWEKAKAAGKSLCQLVNCRLKCRKSDIVNKCGEDGYTAAKKLVKELAELGQTTHAQFRPTQNFPDECKADAIVTGA